jgi:hypothetical protein
MEIINAKIFMFSLSSNSTKLKRRAHAAVVISLISPLQTEPDAGFGRDYYSP